MKKIVLFLLSILLSFPAMASVSFYQEKTGEIVMEVTDCESIARVMKLVEVPDDPPGTGTEDEQNPTQDEKQSDVSDPVATGVTTLVDALIGEEPEDNDNKKEEHGISSETEDLLDASSFQERQDSFITFVRDVNWKTGMHVTFRDYNFFFRLKMACLGITQLSKPLRVKLDAYTDELDETIEKVANAGIDKLAQAARSHSFSAMTKLSVIGLAIAIEKENPFILLALDENTYNHVVAYEPRVATLFEDMYTFFKIRSVRMGDYDKNLKELIRVSRIGKGDSFNTWHIMAEYAKSMLELKRQGALNVQDERDVHIWRLESSMDYIKEQVRVEKRAAKIAAKDPNNAQLMQEISREPKKKPSLNDKAKALLRKSTPEEIKHLIRKYISE